jgi:hypothetical protein
MENSKAIEPGNSKDGGAAKGKKPKRKPSSRSLLKAKDLLLDKVLAQLAHHAELKAECQKFADKVFDRFVQEERTSINHS